MNNRHFQKLKRFLTLTDEDNPALKQQLDTVVVHKHKNRFGLKIIIFFLRLLMPHKVIGKEHLQGLEDGTVVLTCATTARYTAPWRPRCTCPSASAPGALRR